MRSVGGKRELTGVEAGSAADEISVSNFDQKTVQLNREILPLLLYFARPSTHLLTT